MSFAFLEQQYSVACGLKNTPVALFRFYYKVFQTLVLGNVLNGEKYYRMVVILFYDLTGIKEHGFMSYALKIMFNFEVINCGVFRKNIFKQYPEGRDILLLVSKVV